MGSMIAFAIVLFLAGGAIAYFGDRLGTYVGKKRISRLGLRPRHTAMLYTFVSGSLIAVLTLGCLLAVDRNVRYALLEGYGKKNELTQQNKKLANQNRNLESRIQQTQTLVSTAQDKLAASQRDLEAKKAAVTESKKSLAESNKQLAAAKSMVNAQLAALHGVEAQLRTEKHSVQVANAQVQQLTGQERRLATDYQRLQRNRTRLIAENKALIGRNKDLSIATKVLALQNLVYARDRDLGRIEIATSLPTTHIKQQLQSWLDTLNAAAEAAGAGRGENGRAISLLDPQDTDAAGHELTEEDHLDVLSDSIAAQRGSVDSVVVVARARFNTPAQTQVQVVMQPYADVLCFKKDQVIASFTVDGTLAPEEILNRLTDFLTNRVRNIAARAGIIPTYNPKTKEASYGELTDTASMVEQIQRIGPNAVVTFVTDADTRASGPLNLHMIAHRAGEQHLARPNETGNSVLASRGAQDVQ